MRNRPSNWAHCVPLDDGDALMLHDDAPYAWRPGDRAVLLIHGLASSHAGAGVRRAAHKLYAAGFRVFRLDLRGCGAGQKYARYAANSGNWRDLGAVARELRRICPESSVAAVGFSLGGNLLLNWLAEFDADRHAPIDAAVTVCPPVDLTVAAANIGTPERRFYDRTMTRRLLAQVARHAKLRPDAMRFTGPRLPRNMREVDMYYTVAVGGYRDVDDYYVSASPRPNLIHIERPTTIVAAADDPLVPVSMFRDLPVSAAVRTVIVRHGGHLGFIGRRGVDPDRYWLDWRIVDWVRSLPRHGRAPCPGRSAAEPSEMIFA